MAASALDRRGTRNPDLEKLSRRGGSHRRPFSIPGEGGEGWTRWHQVRGGPDQWQAWCTAPPIGYPLTLVVYTEGKMSKWVQNPGLTFPWLAKVLGSCVNRSQSFQKGPKTCVQSCTLRREASFWWEGETYLWNIAQNAEFFKINFIPQKNSNKHTQTPHKMCFCFPSPLPTALAVAMGLWQFHMGPPCISFDFT